MLGIIRRFGLNRLALMATLALGTAQAASMERDFSVRMILSGTQSWKGGLQFSEATTAQDYDLSVRLRSNGFLYSDNLLDPDRETRLSVKQQYYARQGLLQLKAENGGKLPQTVPELAALADRARKSSAACADEFECHYAAMQRLAAISVLETNTPKEIEEVLASPGGGNEPRYLFFFGYPGCATRLHITYEVHIAGKRAYDREHKKPYPFSIDRTADTQGSDSERANLCEKYIITVDVKTGTMYVENFFIPSPPGLSVQTINGQVEREMRDLPPPPIVLDWTGALMRQNKESGHENVVLDMTLPLDGNSTFLGDFTGKLKLDMTWSFKPASLPAAPRPK